jgi:hypothetical protein
MAFGLPRATYEKTPVDDVRPDPQYRPKAVLRSEQTCYVCKQAMPAGTTDVTYSTRQRAWRHEGCRWDLIRAQ